MSFLWQATQPFWILSPVPFQHIYLSWQEKNHPFRPCDRQLIFGLAKGRDGALLTRFCSHFDWLGEISRTNPCEGSHSDWVPGVKVQSRENSSILGINWFISHRHGIPGILYTVYEPVSLDYTILISHRDWFPFYDDGPRVAMNQT